MKKFLILFAVLCIMALHTHSGLAGEGEGLIIAPRVTDPIKIDGELDDWRLEKFADKQKIILTKKTGFINSGSIDNDDDFSAVIYTAYDNDALYVLAEVTDDATDQANAGANNWQNDCIEIWIDGAGDAGTMTDRGGNDPDNYQLNVDVKGEPYVYRNNDAGKILPEIESGAELKGTNYTLEVKIPFSVIPELDLDSSRMIGFSISFVDSDKGVWNHILWQGTVEHEPTQWGNLEFSMESLAVASAGKLPSIWGKLKR